MSKKILVCVTRVFEVEVDIDFAKVILAGIGVDTSSMTDVQIAEARAALIEPEENEVETLAKALVELEEA